MRAPLPIAALLIAATALPAQAFIPDDEARRRIVELRNEMHQRLDRIETGSRGQIDLINQLEEMRREIATLRGQVEVLSHELEQAQRRQRDFYVDLDTRLRRFEPGGSTPQPAAEPGAATPPAPALPGDPAMMQPGTPPAPPAADAATQSRDFEAALNLVKEGRHVEAVGAMENFARTHPSSNLLPGAHFWAGTAAFQGRNLAAAINHFNIVLNRWPDDARAPDALLGLANAQHTLGDARASRRSLEGLVQRYPDSEASQVARQRLAAP